MLLHEIKREPIKRKPYDENNPKYFFNPNNMPDRFKQIGSGIGAGILDSEIFLDLKHPNRILKSVRIRNMNDPYYRYLRMIELHQNNPYFPKIYGVKVMDYNDKQEYGDNGQGDQHIMYVWMEKLQRMNSIDQREARLLLRNQGIAYQGKMDNDNSLHHQFRKPEFRKEVRTNAQDKQFIQAMRLLEPMIKKFGSDLHIDNFMIRPIGSKHQLVIVDPLYPDFGDREGQGGDEATPTWMKYSH